MIKGLFFVLFFVPIAVSTVLTITKAKMIQEMMLEVGS